MNFYLVKHYQVQNLQIYLYHQINDTNIFQPYSGWAFSGLLTVGEAEEGCKKSPSLKSVTHIQQ